MPGIREIRQKFKSSIRRGTGEAYLLLRDNPKNDFSKEIIAACIRNCAYDGQCEQSRAPYLYELAALSGKIEEIKLAILHALAAFPDDCWTKVQLFELAKFYAQDGHNDASEAIYDNFFKRPFTDDDWAGYAEILELDGLEGMKFIASKVGKALTDNPDEKDHSDILRRFQKAYPEIDARMELEKAATNDPFIEAYLQNESATNTTAYSPKVEAKYKNAVDEVLQVKSAVRIRYRQWTKSELMEIARQLVIEKNGPDRAKLLSVFRYNKFPLEAKFLLQIAHNKNVKSRMRYFAFDAMSLLKNREVRNFAVDRMLNDSFPQKFIVILKANYKKGDGKLLTEVINKTQSENLIELLAVNLTDVYRTNNVKECAAPLEALYNKSNCALHRYDVLKLLIENNVLSAQIKEEMRFDCNDDIRALVTK